MEGEGKKEEGEEEREGRRKGGRREEGGRKREYNKRVEAFWGRGGVHHFLEGERGKNK